MTLNCNICGFLAVEMLGMPAAYAQYDHRAVTHHKIGDLSAYHAADWKPPKTVRYF